MKHRPQPSQQLSFASHEFAQKKRVTRREKFLAEMEQVVPWALPPVREAALHHRWSKAPSHRRISALPGRRSHLFHYKKVRYKGLAKNEAQLYCLFGLANLVSSQKAPAGFGAPRHWRALSADSGAERAENKVSGLGIEMNSS